MKMTSATLTKRSLALIPALLLALIAGLANQAFAGWDYGDGRHGSFVLTTNATIEQLYQTVRLTNDPAQYNPYDSNAIPSFQNLILTNGATLTATPWNGSTGGWIVLKAQGTLFIPTNSTISASGAGYRGGGYTFQAGFSAGIQGESYAGIQSVSTSANYGGGGGGETIGAGGGGGYATPGTRGNLGNGDHGGVGGGTYGTPSLSTVYLGSGGGGGNHAGGGGGGGAIVLNAGVLNVQGGMQATGGSGDIGGAGSGGSILLSVGSVFLGTNQVNAAGGNGSPGWGGSGGDGRIVVEYAESYTGITTPVAYTLNDTNSDSIQITNQPGSQTNFLGANVLLNVSFTTISPYTLQWYFNGVVIPGATNQSLLLSNLALTNQGYYWLTISNLAMTINSSNVYLTVLDTNTPFGDGIPNWWKEEYGLSTNNPTLATNYPSGDQLTYLDKYLYGLNPLTNDTDGDSLTDYAEVFVHHTNPLSTNTAGDGIPDGWKVQHGLNPLVGNANNQIGSSGVTYWQIYQYNQTHTNQIDPRNPFFAPGTSIYEVLNNGQHTNRFYYDREDRLLGAEYSRGISIAYTYDGNGNIVRQTVLSRANETNGLPVLWQFLNGFTNSANSDPYADPDGDGWSNYQEWLAGSNPTNALSTPNLLGNAGINIASLTLPFTPSNFVVGVGQLDGLGAEEIVIGTDGNPGTNTNFLLVLTQTFTGWSTQRVDVGKFGITSIAVGQLTNRPGAEIYVGLRGTTNGSGRVMEFTSNGGTWQSNVVALSTNQSAFVLGVRGQDVLVSLATTNAPGGSLSAVSFTTNWNLSLMDTNSSHRGLGTLLQPQQQPTSTSALRLLDSGGIAVGTTQFSVLTPNLVSYWTLDGNSKDAAGSNDGIDTAITYSNANGRINQGAGFNGSTSVIRTANRLSFTDVTFSAWIKTTANNLEIVADDSGPGQYVASMRVASHNFMFGVGLTGTGWVGSIVGSTPIDDGNWHFVVGMRSGSTYTIYVDGKQDGQATGSAMATTSIPIAIGAEVYGGRLWDVMNGDIDEVGIWSRALSASEVGSLFGNGSGVMYPGVLLPEPAAIRTNNWRGHSLASGSLRGTNGSSIFYTFVDDKNANSLVDVGDDFVTAEYLVSGTNASLLTTNHQPIAALTSAQSYGLASVNFLNSSKEIFFTGEPDGQVFAWTASGTTNPLQRQLFSAHHLGKAWHALAGVRTFSPGEGLAGLLVDPASPNTCNVILWPSQASLPQPPNIVETAPAAAVLPSANPLGSVAVVTVRLWDAEGNASTPFLQYQLAGSTSWQTAKLTAVDGVAYDETNRVTALPSGFNHAVAWNAMNDLGAAVVTNVLLRARAQDFMLIGDWSLPTPFQVNISSNISSNLVIGPSQLLADGRFQLTVIGGVLGQSYILLASTNLVDWIPISGYTFTNPPIVIFDPDAANFRWRFYRIGPLSSTPAMKLGLSSVPPFNSNGFNLTLFSLRGLRYQIDASTNLINWITITNFVSTNSIFYFSDPAAKNFNQRFYRAVVH
jgi:YD repeat-containing protein